MISSLNFNNNKNTHPFTLPTCHHADTHAPCMRLSRVMPHTAPPKQCSIPCIPVHRLRARNRFTSMHTGLFLFAFGLRYIIFVFGQETGSHPSMHPSMIQIEIKLQHPRNLDILLLTSLSVAFAFASHNNNQDRPGASFEVT
jgi:hypothetical protein